MIRRPTGRDAGGALLGVAMIAIGYLSGGGPAWPLAVGGLAAVVLTACTDLTWPPTAAAVAVMLLRAVGPYDAVAAVTTGLLVAAYLVLTRARADRVGLVWLATGALVATAVALAAVAVGPSPGLGWMVIAAVAAPAAIWLLVAPWWPRGPLGAAAAAKRPADRAESSPLG